MDIKDLIYNGNTVHFAFYRQQYFYYNVLSSRYNCHYQFPVPLDDIGTATLKSQDKAITFMRWIRKAIEDKTLVKL